MECTPDHLRPVLQGPAPCCNFNRFFGEVIQVGERLGLEQNGALVTSGHDEVPLDGKWGGRLNCS